MQKQDKNRDIFITIIQQIEKENYFKVNFSLRIISDFNKVYSELKNNPSYFNLIVYISAQA